MSDPTLPRQLRRSGDDRVLAGVAAGLARYLRIDPVLVRIGFVVSVFFGGLGVVAYAAAWLLVADESGRTVLGLGRGGLDRTDGLARVAGIVLVFLAAALVLDHWSSANDVVTPLLLIGAGAWLLLRSGPDDDDAPTPPPPPADADRPVPRPPGNVHEPYTTTVVATPPPPSPVAAPPSGPPVGQITFAIVILAGGAFGLAANVWDGLTLSAALITCLAITGVGLVTGGFLGRAAGLIPLGLVLLFTLSLTSALDVDLRGGMGERRFAPQSVDEIQDEYRLGIGELVIDLGDIAPADLRGRRIEIDATIAVGSLEIVLPAGVTVTGSADAQLGDVTAFGQQDDGPDPTVTVDRPGPEGAGIISVDAEVGVGEVVVR